MFGQRVQAEMFEDMVAVGAIHRAANSIVQSFDNPASCRMTVTFAPSVPLYFVRLEFF